jgi:hypothetical protein
MPRGLVTGFMHEQTDSLADDQASFRLLRVTMSLAAPVQNAVDAPECQ